MSAMLPAPSGGNDTPAIQAVIDGLGPKGGSILFSDRYLIDTTLIVRDRVRLLAESAAVPQLISVPDSGPGININPAATVTLGHEAAVEGLTILRKGLIAPENSAAAFAGTALTAAGHGNRVHRCGIFGFNQLFYSNGLGRHHLIENNGDGVNGFKIVDSQDTLLMVDNHLWPFATALANPATRVTAWGPGHYLHRTGNAYELVNCSDWAKLTDCFSFAHGIGFLISSSAAVQLKGCGSDGVTNPGAGTKTIPGTIGFAVVGTSDLVSLIGWQAAARQYGMLIQPNTNDCRITVADGHAWAIEGNPFQIAKGTVDLHDNVVEGWPGLYGAWVGDAGVVVDFHHNRFKGFSTGIIAAPANGNVASRYNQFIGVTTAHSGVSASKILSY